MSHEQILAGTNAKRDGHLNEQKICTWLNENLPGTHIVEGGNKTKVDIANVDSLLTYSLKSVSKNHTQCHLTSTSKWCEYFEIQDSLRNWFDCFFGVPTQDVSQGKNRRHRLISEDIESDLNLLALNWFNSNRIPIFDVILQKGMYDTPVTHLIWHSKKTKQIDVYDIDVLRDMVYNGTWILNSTTLHFLTDKQEKLFHLQMKGSGKKYTSGYHGLMFHIHKCF
jgi:hypothetical protein